MRSEIPINEIAVSPDIGPASFSADLENGRLSVGFAEQYPDDVRLI